MKNKKGYSLVELLIVSALALIIGVGVFRVVNEVVRNNAQSSSMIKNKEHLFFVIGSITKIISTAGFGIDKDNLDYGKVIDIVDEGKKLKIKTRASTLEKESGCWGYIDKDGNFKLSIYNNDIEPVSFSTYTSCPTTADKYPVKISIEDKSPNCNKNCVAFSSPATTDVEVYYDGTTASGCLPNTGKGMIKLNNSSNPFVSCVADMRFYYIYNKDGKVIEKASYDNRPEYNSLVGVRLCAMVQLTEVGGQSITEPQYSERCGGKKISELNGSIQWRKAQWGIVERDIMMINIQKPSN